MPSIAPHPGIEALYFAWARAYRERDIDAIFALLTDDYVLWAPGLAPMTRDSLGPRLKAVMDTYDITPSFDCEERIISGALAFERGWDVQHAQPRAGGEPKVQRSRVFLVLQQGSDGQWRFARGMSQAGPDPTVSGT